MNEHKDTSESELRYSTATDEDGRWVRQEEPDAKPVIHRRRRMTTKERWLTPNSGKTPKAADPTTPHQVSPEMMKFILKRLDELDLRLSDCTFNPDGSVVIPTSPKKRDHNAHE